ncbi:hypothetical protein HY642_05860 [Candidatus Woesearchaeota archaeon]|nr:hypothetical protein [Candidatus Woesearchaeota archaeon]
MTNAQLLAGQELEHIIAAGFDSVKCSDVEAVCSAEKMPDVRFRLVRPPVAQKRGFLARFARHETSCTHLHWQFLPNASYWTFDTARDALRRAGLAAFPERYCAATQYGFTDPYRVDLRQRESLTQTEAFNGQWCEIYDDGNWKIRVVQRDLSELPSVTAVMAHLLVDHWKHKLGRLMFHDGRILVGYDGKP